MYCIIPIIPYSKVSVIYVMVLRCKLTTHASVDMPWLNFSLSTVWEKVPEGSTLIFRKTHSPIPKFPYTHCKASMWKPALTAWSRRIRNVHVPAILALCVPFLALWPDHPRWWNVYVHPCGSSSCLQNACKHTHHHGCPWDFFVGEERGANPGTIAPTPTFFSYMWITIPL